MALVLTFSGRSGGSMCGMYGPEYQTDVLIEFVHEDDSTKISLTDDVTGIKITAKADSLFSYLTRVL